MNDPIKKDFKKSKNQVYKNFSILKERFIFWSQLSLTDPNHVLYNTITELLNNIRSVKTSEELEVFIEKGKNIENELDVYLEKEGQNSKALLWP
jgi:hypothetical protein